jgi:uncharacterized protein YjbI with pentapeptide repeats
VILRDALVGYADLGEIKLRNATLRRTSFAHAWMRAAVLENADIADADFRSAILRSASFRFTKMRRAEFTGADLTDAVEGQREEVESIQTDKTT